MFLLDLLFTIGVMTVLVASQTATLFHTNDLQKGQATGQYIQQLQASVNTCLNNGTIDGTLPQPISIATLQQKGC